MPPDDLQKLKKAIDGLTYPSESDEPFEIFIWDSSGTAHDQVAAHAGHGRKIEEVPWVSFFSQLDDSEDAPRYRELKRVIESVLSNPQAFRAGAGEVHVDVFMIGKARTGEWAGLHTVSVET
jgi:hypothetical protein